MKHPKHAFVKWLYVHDVPYELLISPQNTGKYTLPISKIRSSQFQVKFQLEAVKQKQLFAPIKTDVSNQMNQSKFRARRSRGGKTCIVLWLSNNVALDFQANHIAYPFNNRLEASLLSPKAIQSNCKALNDFLTVQEVLNFHEVNSC